MPYQVGRGKWRAELVVRGVRRTRMCPTRQAAVKWEVSERQRIRETMTTAYLRAAYLDYLDRVRAYNSAKTYHEKQYLIKRVLAAWGDMPVTDITPERVQRFLIDRATQTSPCAANNDRKNLSAFCNWLRVKGIRHNPVEMITKMPHERAPVTLPTQAEIGALLTAAQGQDRVILISELSTAGRKGEIFRWKWDEDINFERRMVRLGTRKTRGGEMRYQWLPMPDTLYRELMGHYQRRVRTCPWVFPCLNPRSSSYMSAYVTRKGWMQGLCERAGVRHIRFRDLRPYVASRQADKGKVTMRTLQRLLRHERMATTEGYIGTITKDLDILAESLEEDFNNGKDKEDRKKKPQDQ